LNADHSDYINLLRKLRKIDGIKRVFIRSGIRYDYFLADKSDEFLNELVKYHVSGQLRVAPEHCSQAVLDKMGKPRIEAYKKFSDMFYKATKQAGRDQYIVPYLMSSHPGCTLKDAVELAVFLKKEKIHPEQVQDFYPTPGTISTAMFYTGLDPYTLEEVYIPKNPKEKAMQRALMQYFVPKNRELVLQALRQTGRLDLAGSGKNCLVTAPKNYKPKNDLKKKKKFDKYKRKKGKKH
jgi:uncharacterized radical SAM protein YgiQ